MPGTVYYNQVKGQILDRDYKKYNFFNSVMKTTLPHDEFHERVGGLLDYKKGGRCYLIRYWIPDTRYSILDK